jgi:hypothetical protein
VYDDSDHASTSHSGHDGEMTVNVDGEQYEVHEDYDLDHDGTNETAVIQTDDGGAVAFSDSNHDGTADVAVEVDDHGNVVGAARYDEHTGEWVAVDPKTGQETGGDSHMAGAGSHSTSAGDHTDHSTGSGSGSGSGSSSSHSGGGEEITADIPDQKDDADVGQATVDSNHDGKADTAVVHNDDGSTMAFTDVDGDGKADEVTIIEANGDVTIGQHTGADEWTDVEHGHVDSHGNYTPDRA